jgi:hypothetical protein
MDEPKMDSKEIRDTPSKEDLPFQQDLAPQGMVEEESAFPLDLDQESRDPTYPSD